MDKILKLCGRILEQNNYLTLATADGTAKPWISPLYYSYDNEGNLYWSSAKNSRHSQLLLKNPCVAIVIYNEAIRTDPRWNCLYITAQAHEVSEEEFPKALDNYYRRGHPVLTEDENNPLYAKDFLGDSPRRLYKAIPDKIYLLSPPTVVEGHIFDRRVAVSPR